MPVRRPTRQLSFDALESRELMARGGASDVAFRVQDFMGWTTAPQYNSPVDYQSSGAWEDLKVVNYEPSHYPHFNASGTITFSDGVTPLLDTTFQNNLGTDFPLPASYGTYVNYLQGTPQITIKNDFRQLQAAGFDGVRLYASPPNVYIAAILAAAELTAEAPSKPFYVEYEVAAPDLSANFNVGSVASRINGLFQNEVNANPPEGAFQSLHYVIQIVTPKVFSQVVPLVYFTHENLVSTNGEGGKMTDDNTSTPLLRWGINATRALLAKELAGNPLPSVTTALLVGHVVQVSLDVQPEVKTLVDVIQHDPNAPIAYDVYPFQWANRYFNEQHDYVNDNNNIIPNAYPVGNGGKISYYDRTARGGDEWTSGPPPSYVTDPIPHTIPDTVNDAGLMWSLQWSSDRVNWIWGHLAHGTDTTKQVIAETGWASTQEYTQKESPSGGAIGKLVTGTQADAKLYYSTLAGMGFKIGNTPVMYFSAYDEPLKTSNAHPHMFSENHYGIFGWSALPKYFSDPAAIRHPLTKPFTIVGFVPTNPLPGTPQTNPRQSARDTSYTYQIVGRKQVKVPWYYGGTAWTDGVNGRITFMPNPSILLSGGDRVDITSPQPGTNFDATISLVYDASANQVVYYNNRVANAGQNLTAPDGNNLGSAWKLYFSFPWLHNGSNDFNNTNMFPRVYQNFWSR